MEEQIDRALKLFEVGLFAGRHSADAPVARHRPLRSICLRCGFVAAFENRVVQIGRMYFSRVECYDDALSV